MILPVEVTIETGEPEVGDWAIRWATVKLNGVPLFSNLVYDTDSEGNRTDEQAARNILLTLQGQARRYLEDAL